MTAMQPDRPIGVFIIIGLVLLFPALSQADSPSSLVQKGNTAYEKGHFDEALKAYEQAGVDDPESPQISFNEGAAYYRKGDFAKAKAAWEKASLNSKDLSLEAKAVFNLGNLAFSEAKRQQDSDLQKALDTCTQSIKHYQHTIDLLKKTADAQQAGLKKNAAENIEMVRLVMKSILDALQKQQAEQKQAQQAGRQDQPSHENQKAQASQEQQEASAPEGQEKQQSASIARMPDDAENILNEEKENLKNRRPLAPGGYQGIDKDW
jgi:Ca-activated chloride channel homolog